MALAELVARACMVHSLALVASDINPQTAAEVGRGLRSNSTLVDLDLSCNPLGAGGVRGLLRYFPGNRTLRRLWLRNCSLDEDCAVAIVNRILLSEVNRIELLDLADNALPSRCLEAIARAVRCHFRIKVLALDGNGDAAPAPPESGAIDAVTVERGRQEPELGSAGDSKSAGLTSSSQTAAFWPLSQCQAIVQAALTRNQAVAEAIDAVLDATILLAMRQSRTTVSRVAVQDSHDGLPRFKSIAGSSFSFGFAETRGRRQKMEDVVLLKPNFRRQENEHLFGVFDGHGGVECARFAQATFSDCLAQELAPMPALSDDLRPDAAGADGGPPGAARSPNVEGETRSPEVDVHDVSATVGAQTHDLQLEDGSGATKAGVQDEARLEACLTRAFQKVQERCADFQIQNGSCALVSLFVRDTLCVASVGDSRALLVRMAEMGSSRPASAAKEEAIWLSETLTPLTAGERERIERQGGFVTSNGRVCGVLAVSRALGDLQFREIISSEPTLQTRKLRPEDKWLILGCDGVWDVLDELRILELVRFVSDPVRAAQKIRDAAFELGSRDNITVVCVRLNAEAGVAPRRLLPLAG